MLVHYVCCRAHSLRLLLPMRKALEYPVNIALLTVARHTEDRQAITKYGWSALSGSVS